MNKRIMFEPALGIETVVRPAVSGDRTTCVTFKATILLTEWSQLQRSLGVQCVLELWTNVSAREGEMGWRAIPFEESTSNVADAMDDEKKKFHVSTEVACPTRPGAPPVRFGYTFRVRGSKMTWLGNERNNGAIVVDSKPFWDNSVRKGKVVGVMHPNGKWRAWCHSPNEIPRMVEPIGTDLPLLIAQTILFVPCAPTVARLPMLLFHSSKAPIQVNDGQVTCITPGSVQHRPNVSPGELPPILKAITPDLSILSSSDEYYLYTYSPAFHAPDSTSFVFHPLTLLASSSPGVNPNQYAITIRMKDVLRILPSSVVLPLVVHQSTKIPTFLSQRRYDDPDTIYAILPNEPIRIVRMYSLPPQARAVGDEASSEQLDLVGLVTPGQAAVHTLAKTTATTTTTTGAMGIRKRGIRGSSGGGADTPSTATVIGDDDDDLGEKKKNTGGKIDSAKSGAMLTVSKSRVGAKGGVVLRRTIPVPNSIRKVFDRRGILSNVAALALTLLFNLFVLLSSLTGLRMRLEWEKEKKYDHQGKRESEGGRDDDDDTRNGYELDQVTSTPRPNRRLPFTSSFFSSAPAPTSSSSPPPPRLSHFVVLPTSTIHAQSPSGSGQSTIQGRGTGGAGGAGGVGAHAHVLYKGTHTDTLRFFVKGKALDPWSIVHTSFEFLSQSQSQSPSQEGQTPQSQESEKGDDFHEFLLKIEDRHRHQHLTNANANANPSAYNREGEGGGEGVELQIVSSY